MQNLLVLTLICAYSIVYAQDTAEIVKATPVKLASEVKWETARNSAQKLIADSTYSDSIFSGFLLMIGPRLWDQLDNYPELVKLNLGNMILGVPTYDKKGKKNGLKEEKGKITQGKSQYQAVMKVIYTSLDIGSGKITELNQRDKFFCWQYFAKVEEPIVAIETSKGRLILQFSGSGLLFIESTGY